LSCYIKKVGWNAVMWQKIWLVLIDSVKSFYTAGAYIFFSCKIKLLIILYLIELHRVNMHFQKKNMSGATEPKAKLKMWPCYKFTFGHNFLKNMELNILFVPIKYVNISNINWWLRTKKNRNCLKIKNL
jgi:hypothetical protein